MIDLLQAEGASEILVAGEPERRYEGLCKERGAIPYHPNQIDMIVRTQYMTRVDACTCLDHDPELFFFVEIDSTGTQS